MAGPAHRTEAGQRDKPGTKSRDLRWEGKGAERDPPAPGRERPLPAAPASRTGERRRCAPADPPPKIKKKKKPSVKRTAGQHLLGRALKLGGKRSFLSRVGRGHSPRLVRARSIPCASTPRGTAEPSARSAPAAPGGCDLRLPEIPVLTGKPTGIWDVGQPLWLPLPGCQRPRRGCPQEHGSIPTSGGARNPSSIKK